MTQEIQPFTFNGLQLRALLINQEPWFVAMDVAQVLGYALASDITRHLDNDEKGMENLHTPGGEQTVSTINESGLYSAILRSRKLEAKAFKKWVTNDVLPTIRKTGTYTTPQTLEQRSLALIGELSAVVQEQKAELEQARPKADVYDRVLTKDHTFGFRELASALREHFPVNENDLRDLLRYNRIVYKAGSRVKAYSEAIDAGLCVQRPEGTYGGRERFSIRYTTKCLELLLKDLKPLEDAT